MLRSMTCSCDFAAFARMPDVARCSAAGSAAGPPAARWRVAVRATQPPAAQPAGRRRYEGEPLTSEFLALLPHALPQSIIARGLGGVCRDAQPFAGAVAIHMAVREPRKAQGRFDDAGRHVGSDVEMERFFPQGLAVFDDGEAAK